MWENNIPFPGKRVILNPEASKLSLSAANGDAGYITSLIDESRLRDWKSNSVIREDELVRVTWDNGNVRICSVTSLLPIEAEYLEQTYIAFDGGKSVTLNNDKIKTMLDEQIIKGRCKLKLLKPLDAEWRATFEKNGSDAYKTKVKMHVRNERSHDGFDITNDVEFEEMLEFKNKESQNEENDPFPF